VLCYLLGSIPFGWLLHRLRGGGDIRLVGSGNIGATNVLRAQGWWAGLLTLAADAGKGAGAVWLGREIGGSAEMAAACGMAAVLGHVFPVSLGFRGGKGVATGLGFVACLVPPAALVGVAVFMAVVGWKRTVSLASLAACVSVALSVPALRGWGAVSAAVLAVTALIVWRHRDNLRRLRRGTEPRLGADRGHGEG
jgi:glycerol-3-phosphate acyltransferase PlsY